MILRIRKFFFVEVSLNMKKKLASQLSILENLYCFLIQRNCQILQNGSSTVMLANKSFAKTFIVIFKKYFISTRTTRAPARLFATLLVSFVNKILFYRKISERTAKRRPKSTTAGIYESKGSECPLVYSKIHFI